MRTDTRRTDDQPLRAEQAARLLGVSERTVRRWIASGKLSGITAPCSTTRAAVDALRRQQQARSGEVVTAPDSVRDSADNGGHDDHGPVAVMDAADVAYVINMLAARAEELAREVGRLEAEVAQARAGQNGHGGRALSRLVPWLRG